MLHFLPGPVLFILSLSLLIINTAVWGSLVCIGGLFKLLLPWKSGRIAMTRLMNRFMWAWASCNGGILHLIAKVDWDVQGLESLKPDGWYLLISNHLSGFDIAAQTYILRNNIPMLKFFLKKELLYVPIMGLGCWALDMPFMNRTSPEKLKKNPKLRGKDLQNDPALLRKIQRLAHLHHQLCGRQSLYRRQTAAAKIPLQAPAAAKSRRHRLHLVSHGRAV